MLLPMPHLQRRSKNYADKLVPKGMRFRKSYQWKEPNLLIALPGFSHFVDFANQELIPLLPLVGRKLVQKRSLLCEMLYQLLYSGIRGNLIRDTRSTAGPKVRIRVGLWDLLKKHGWIDVYPGSRVDKRQTRYQAMPALLSFLPSCQHLFASAPLARNTQSPDKPVKHSLVYGHSGKTHVLTGEKLPEAVQKLPLPFPEPDSIDFWYLHLLEDALQEVNRSNALHHWLVDLAPGVRIMPDVALRQVHVGAWERAPRMYTSGFFSAQSLKKTTRQTMTIDGEATVELDYSSMVPRMVYHSLGLEAVGDVYRTDQVFPRLKQFAAGDEAFRSQVRNMLKRATNIMFNVGTHGKAIKAVAYRCREYLSDDRFHKFFHEIEGLTFRSLVERIENVHPDIKTRFFGFTGMEMMTHEALIMLLSLIDITLTGRPALGIHDAIVCKETDADFVKSIMVKNYMWRFPGFTPEIK